MIVVDTNVLAYLYLPGEQTLDAKSLFQREPEWVAPPLWRSEFRNILAAYVRRKTPTFDLAFKPACRKTFNPDPQTASSSP